jgi:hypothetical protein
MNRQVASSRLKDVLNVDSINSTQADFLSTHVPFQKITVTNELTGTPISDYISEEQIFNKYFNNSDMYNRHQLIVVDGSSGSGKSHFIRWISAKLNAQEEQKDVVLMIRRSDNTLKGTIKQFLDIEEVKNIKNKDIYERLVRANQNVSEQRFKYEIYHKFLVEIADDVESILSSNDRKNFRELLSSSEFEERMLMAGGPIERIYSKIVDSDSGNNEDTLALFDVDDFTMDFDINTKLKDNASKKACKMANKLLPQKDGSYVDDECSPETVTSYMNSKVEQVIRSCAGIEQGDFQQIFKEIRQELFRQGKNLFLLIEDITSCTGINQDLLNALIVEHTGTNEADRMCRLVSVIGTTTEYFKEFRDNYIDRITTKITMEDGSIGNNADDLIQFVAKYLNIMSIRAEEVNKWYRDGALESEYPVHVDPDIKKWESYNFNSKSLSLYPFTKRAIINLYNGLEQHKTPRYILRKIIEPAVDNILQDKKSFPKFLKSKSVGLTFDVEARIKSILVNIQINTEEKDEYRDRVFSVIGFWGDGTLSIKNNNSIGTVSAGIFKEFNLEKFAEKVLGVSIGDSDISDPIDDPIISPTDPSITDPPKPKPPETNKAFDDFARILSDWHYEKKSFTKAYPVRDEICKFIFASIAWQREGVSLLSVQMVENSSYNLISIERQDRAIDKGLVLLEGSDDTYQLLLAFGKWLHIGKQSWNFNNAASSIRFVTSWLEKNKSKFIDIVKDYDDKIKYPEYVRCALIAEIYRGIINGDYQITKISDIKTEMLLKSQNERIKKNSTGHSAEWTELQDNILYADGKAEENIELIQRYFNLIQGNVKNAKIKIIKYTSLEEIFKEIRKDCFETNLEEFTIDKIKDRNTSKDYLKKIILRLEKVVKAESKGGKECHKEVLKYFGFSEGVEIEVEDIKDLLNEIIEFYKDAEINGINITPRTNEASNIKQQSNSIVKALDILNMDLSEKSLLEIIILYSQNPMKIVKQFIKLLEDVNVDREKVYLEMQKEKEVLTRSGNWSDDADPRFESEKASFDEVLKLMEV